VDREPVSSTHLRSVGYDEGTRTLEVEFQNGKVYEYRGVGSEVHAALVESGSPGRFFQESVRNKIAGVRVK
jgi:hypothetical protein